MSAAEDIANLKARMTAAEASIAQNRSDHANLYNEIKTVDRKVSELLGRSNTGAMVINGIMLLVTAVFGSGVGAAVGAVAAWFFRTKHG